MRSSVLTLITAFFCVPLVAQNIKYAALFIPDSLTKNADAVVREDRTFFKIKDIDNATLQSHSIVTVRNSDANKYLQFHYTSDKFSYLESAEIIVYNAMGMKLNAYTKKEMHMSGYASGLVEDGQTTWFDVTAASYPITVETNYTVKYKGSLFYPQYDIQYPYQSVQASEFIIEVPANLGFRYRCMNNATAPQITPKGDVMVYTWQNANLPAQRMEKHCGSFRNYLPYVMVAPNKFQMDDYTGDMASWKQFGQWYASLLNKTNLLSEQRKAFFNDLVKDATTDKQKATIIYNYLQQNMRYVSIQLGIGGWKPLAASFVDEKKYGDCKALSNYMQAALTAVGVKSYNAIIFWDDGISQKMRMPLSEDFPVNKFNHVVVCIPQAKDSIWLECTSTTAAFGDLGSGKQNKTALLVTENGGVLVQTPKSKPHENTRSCHTDIQLNEDGSGKVAAVLNATGDFREEQLYFLGQSTSDEKTRYFVNHMEWKHPDNLQIKAGSKAMPIFNMAANMDYEKVPSFSTANKMFLPIRLYPLMGEEVPENDKRTQDFFFSFPYQKSDTTVYHLPTGFTVDYKPTDKTITYPFGKYTSNFNWDAAANTLTVVANLEIAQPYVKAADYKELYQFAKIVSADVNEKLVVKRL